MTNLSKIEMPERLTKMVADRATELMKDSGVQKEMMKFSCTKKGKDWLVNLAIATLFLTKEQISEAQNKK